MRGCDNVAEKFHVPYRRPNNEMINNIAGVPTQYNIIVIIHVRRGNDNCVNEKGLARTIAAPLYENGHG